jgi:hypothetical protein
MGELAGELVNRTALAAQPAWSITWESPGWLLPEPFDSPHQHPIH